VVPSNHELDLEGLHSSPTDDPLWSENFAWTGFDPGTDVGVFLHLGRSPVGPDLWRSVVVAYLPGETLLVSKTVAPSPGGIGNGSLSLTCLEPMQRWGIRYRGAGRPTSRKELAGARLVDGEVVGLEIDLTFDARAPIWDMGAMHSLGDTHYEQHGRLAGTVSADGRTYSVDGSGYRDHSTGRRDLTGLGGHVWTHAMFPSGRAFSALRVFAPDGRLALSTGVIVADGVLTSAAADSAPDLDDASGQPAGGVIAFPGHAPVAVETRHGVTLTLGQPNDFFFGHDPALGRQVLTDCPASFNWDGEVTTGWLERSRTFP
jgi:hypothetical protein